MNNSNLLETKFICDNCDKVKTSAEMFHFYNVGTKSFDVSTKCQNCHSRKTSLGRRKKKTDYAGKIYFVLSKTLGYVKIGFATNIEKRFSALQGMNADELELICVINGTMEQERQIQEQFLPYHCHHEWFMYSDDLKQFLDAFNLQNKAYSSDFDTLQGTNGNVT